MKVTVFTSLVTSALLAQQAAAVDWSGAQTFSCPANSDNQCSDTQKSGFNWSDLPTGNVGNYNGFQFSGFTCSNSFSSAKFKRALALRSDFNSKCVQGKASTDAGSNPKISCDNDKQFSITNMQVSVDQDTMLDFHFDMPDGSTCKQSQKCTSAGTVVTNEQCGGAKAVSVQVNKDEKRDCDFGIHSINFDCSPPATTSKSSTTTASTTTSKIESSTTSNVVTTTTEVKSSTTEVKSSTTPASSSIPTTTSAATETAPVTTTSAPASSSTTIATTTTSPAESDKVTTEIVITTLTTCPVTVTSVSLNSTITSVSSTISTTTITSTATFCPKCGEAPPTAITISTPVETSPSSSVASSSTSIGPVTASTTTTPVIPTPPVSTTKSEKESSTTPVVTTTIPESSSITTEIVITTVTSCSATITSKSGSITITSVVPTVSTTVITSTVTVCTRCTEAPPSTLQSSTAVAPTTESSSAPPTKSSTVAPPPNVPCPEVVPRCLNTWLMAVPSCQSNSDITCFCPDKDFISKVQGCISAWGGSDAELQGAFSFLTGICANFVPQNPGICTGVPSTITLVPSPTPAPVTSVKTIVSTVGTSLATVTVTSTDKSTITATAASQPITTITITSDHSGVMTTQYITVPQVVFITNTATSIIQTTVNEAGNTVIMTMAPPAGSPPVGLVPALPEITSSLAAAAAAASPSSTTAAHPASSTAKNSAIGTPTRTISPVGSFTGAATIIDAKAGLSMGVAGVLAVVAFVV